MIDPGKDSIMRASLRSFLLFTPALLVIACGSGKTSTTTSGSGGHETTGSTSGSGGAAGAGGSTASAATGGSTASGSSSSSNGSSSSGSSSGSSSTSGSSSSSSGADGGPAGACTDAEDMALIAVDGGGTVETEVNACAQQHLAMEPATKTCIEGIKPDGTHTLTKACADCYDGAVECGASKCAGMCFANSMSSACLSCIATNCTPAFNTCSGL
jgi:hypothetical protein